MYGIVYSNSLALHREFEEKNGAESYVTEYTDATFRPTKRLVTYTSLIRHQDSNTTKSSKIIIITIII